MSCTFPPIFEGSLVSLTGWFKSASISRPHGPMYACTHKGILKNPLLLRMTTHLLDPTSSVPWQPPGPPRQATNPLACATCHGCWHHSHRRPTPNRRNNGLVLPPPKEESEKTYLLKCMLKQGRSDQRPAKPDISPAELNRLRSRVIGAGCVEGDAGVMTGSYRDWMGVTNQRLASQRFLVLSLPMSKSKSVHMIGYYFDWLLSLLMAILELISYYIFT